MKKYKNYWLLSFLFIFTVFSSKISVPQSDQAVSGIKICFTFGFFGCSSDEKNGTEPEPQEPELVIAPQELYFGRIPEGHSATRDYKLANIGETVLDISSFAIEGNNANQFSLTGNPATLSLDPFTSIVFGVEFTPVASGDFSAQIKLLSNNPTSPNVLPLNGGGTTITGDAVTFERIIGGLDSDGNSSVAITADGGYILAGSATDTLEEVGVAELTRLNMFGDVLWRKQYSGEGTSGFADLVSEDDGSIIAVGHTAASPGRSTDIYAVRTDADGNLIWQTIFGEFEKDEAHAIIKAADGAYILAGETNNTEASGGIKDAMLVKLDGGGNVLWNKLYGTTEGEDARSIAPTTDGGYVFTGIQSVGASGFDTYFVKTDAEGNQVWEKAYRGGEVGNSVASTDDEGFIIAGYTVTQGAGGQDVYIIKTDVLGDTLWTRTYGGIDGEVASTVIQTSDLGYLIVGETRSFGAGGNDVYLIKLNNDGTESWVRFYGGEGGDRASCVQEKPGDGYIVTGTTGSYGGGSNIYVLKLNNSGLLQ
jgi:hypothetical protein